MEGFALYFCILIGLSFINLLILVALVFQVCKIKVHFIFTLALAVLLAAIFFKTNLFPFTSISNALITLGALIFLFVCLYFYNDYKSSK